MFLVTAYLCVLTLSVFFFSVRRDVQEDDEEAVRVKEQSILELGTLLAKTGQAAGDDQHTGAILCQLWEFFTLF